MANIQGLGEYLVAGLISITFPQLLPADLARSGERQLVYELDLPRILEGGEAIADLILNLFFEAVAARNAGPG